MRVTVLGAGMMGTGTVMPLADRGHEVHLVGTHLEGAIVEALRQTRVHPRLGVAIPDGVEVDTIDALGAALARSDAVVLGVSSDGAAWAMRTLRGSLPRALPIAMVTKGLVVESKTLRVLPDVLRDGLAEAMRAEVAPVMIGGPCIAGELALRRPSAVVFAGRDPMQAAWFADAMRTPYYRVTLDDDIVGVCVSAALKNAYATAIGVGTGLCEREGRPPGAVAMHNLEAAIFARAVVEMEALSVALGGRTRTVLGLAGTGDLYVTTQGGRSTQLGRLLGLGRSLAEARVELGNPTLEGVDVADLVVRALPDLEAAGVVRRERFPLLVQLHAILFDGADPAAVFEWVT